MKSKQSEWIGGGGDVLRRTDADGTEWTIRRNPTGIVGSTHILTMSFRDIRLTSTHCGENAAKAHRLDMIRAWQARTLADYQQARSTGVQQ